MVTEEYQWHTCHFCGTDVNKEGYEYNGERHYLSDCRPDLVEHEIGELCTWDFRRKSLTKSNGEIIEPLPENRTCYAYQDKDLKWTDEHKHFYEDGPA